MMKEKLIALIAEETSIEVPLAVQKLSAAIQTRGGVSSILFYGSGLWKEPEEDTIYDFYVMVERFRDFDRSISSAILGSFLPPNVYYMEIQDGEKTLRCKYAVMRIDQFIRAAKGRAITPQIWARFAQPCRITYGSNDKMLDALAECVLSFHRKALPVTLANASPRDIWLRGLSETYGAELRSEKPERTVQIFDANADNFIRRTELTLPLLTFITRESKWSPIINRIKRPFQKFITFIRLAKATLTFKNGVDYALWKIERQSGVKLEANDFQRRYPLIGAWPLVWNLWRKGGFR